MMAMNHEEGPDLISLYRNSRDYSCARLQWKKSLDVFYLFILHFLSVSSGIWKNPSEKESLRKIAKKNEGGLIIFMQLENRYVLNGI